MTETERLAARLADLEREVARLRALEYAARASGVTNASAEGVSVDADGTVTVNLGDAAGVEGVNVLDSGDVQVARVDSDGTAEFAGSVEAGGALRAGGNLALSGQTSAAQGAKALSLADDASASANAVGASAGRGLYVIYSGEDAATCIAVRNGNDTIILSDGMNVFRTTDTDGYSCLLSAAGTAFTIKNRRGSTRTYWIHHLGFPTA